MLNVVIPLSSYPVLTLHLLLSPLKPGSCLLLSVDTVLPSFLIGTPKDQVQRRFSQALQEGPLWSAQLSLLVFLSHGGTVFSFGSRDTSHFWFLHLSLTVLLCFLNVLPLLSCPVLVWCSPGSCSLAFSTLYTQSCFAIIFLSLLCPTGLSCPEQLSPAHPSSGCRHWSASHRETCWPWASKEKGSAVREGSSFHRG